MVLDDQLAAHFPTEYAYKIFTFRNDKDSTSHHSQLLRTSSYAFEGIQIKQTQFEGELWFCSLRSHTEACYMV